MPLDLLNECTAIQAITDRMTSRIVLRICVSRVSRPFRDGGWWAGWWRSRDKTRDVVLARIEFSLSFSKW